jgi:hypothetical protein
MLRLTGSSARDVAQRLKGHLTGPTAPPLHLLPYNRFDMVGENTWWLAPKPGNPAYPWGKLFCSNAAVHSGPDQLRCGLHVEEGIERGTENPAQELGAHWEWHHFVASLISGAFGEAVKSRSHGTR